MFRISDWITQTLKYLLLCALKHSNTHHSGKKSGTKNAKPSWSEQRENQTVFNHKRKTLRFPSCVRKNGIKSWRWGKKRRQKRNRCFSCYRHFHIWVRLPQFILIGFNRKLDKISTRFYSNSNGNGNSVFRCCMATESRFWLTWSNHANHRKKRAV